MIQGEPLVITWLTFPFQILSQLSFRLKHVTTIVNAVSIDGLN